MNIRIMKHLYLILLALIALPALAVPPKPPAALCIEGLTNCTRPPPKPTAGAGLKWHPGHYMLGLAKGTWNNSEITSLPKEIVGYQLRFYWSQLEVAQDQYDFSKIEALLKLCQANNKRLVIQIMDREFNTTVPDGRLPAYLSTDGVYAGTTGNGVKRVLAKTWQPPVMDRLIALYTKLGARFDSEPYFEGIATEETSTALTKDLESTFSTSALTAQLKRQMIAARAAFPTSQVFFYTNYLPPDQMQDLFAQAARSQIAVGGPDILPGGMDTGGQVLTAQSGGTDYRKVLAVGYAVQQAEMGGRKGDWTVQQLNDYARGLGANYLFWARKVATPGIVWATDIQPYLVAHPTLPSACPSSFPRCLTN